MSKAEKKITRADILSEEEYGAVRKEKRAEVVQQKRQRRLPVGPYVTFYFENYDTMWLQVQEMLFIEKGGEAQIPDELEAYNPLIPQGRELVATMMIEIEDSARRQTMLAQLGHIEDTVKLHVNDHAIAGAPEQDQDRTTPEGKTSSVHFLHFPLTDEAAVAFKTEGTKVMMEIAHENYQHMAGMPDDVRRALATDLD